MKWRITTDDSPASLKDFLFLFVSAPGHRESLLVMRAIEAFRFIAPVSH